MRGYDHTARRENTQDDGQVRISGRRYGGHGHHERVRWLEQQNTRSYRGLNRSRWFGDKAPASALIR